ncbi:MAG: hypothetical protein HUJ67_07185 [Ruminiclostridium sp.]|nr:hypothetical protein [Ruminiclostridium sp.]
MDIQQQLEKTQAELKEVRGKYKKALEGCMQIDSHKIYGFLYDRGYPLMETEVGVKFMTDERGPVYLAMTERLPLFELSLSLNVSEENADALSRAAREITETSLMVKSYLYHDSLVLSLATIEWDVRHFNKCFDLYIEQLNRCYAGLIRIFLYHIA